MTLQTDTRSVIARIIAERSMALHACYERVDHYLRTGDRLSDEQIREDAAACGIDLKAAREAAAR